MLERLRNARWFRMGGSVWREGEKREEGEGEEEEEEYEEEEEGRGGMNGVSIDSCIYRGGRREEEEEEEEEE